MQLSFHADYACRVLIYLATMEAERSSVEEIARAFGISQNHLVKVVHKLGKFGFIDTVRGRGGGLRLALSPESIRIGEVVRQMEPGLDLVECFNLATNTCPITDHCGLKPLLYKAREAFLSQLDAVSLAEISRQRRQLAQILSPSPV